MCVCLLCLITKVKVVCSTHFGKTIYIQNLRLLRGDFDANVEAVTSVVSTPLKVCTEIGSWSSKHGQMHS